MGTHKTAGFTILETMLFLAITGMLIMALLTGVGVSINTQRYRDSVQSLKSLIQDQYSQLGNVQNDRDNSWTCNGNAQTSQGSINSGVARGQSHCVILGRYISIDQDAIATQDVIGAQSGTSTQGSDVALLLANYKLSLSSGDPQTSSVEWGSKIAWPISGSGAQSTGTPRSIGILLIRSPDSGTVYTFTIDSPPAIGQLSGAYLAAMLVTGNNVSTTYNSSTLRGQDERTICLDSNGLVTTGNMAIFLQAYASGLASVEALSNDTMLQQGNSSQC
jgi:type II secretory pathway pseudopilin PulG